MSTKPSPPASSSRPSPSTKHHLSDVTDTEDEAGGPLLQRHSSSINNPALNGLDHELFVPADPTRNHQLIWNRNSQHPYYRYAAAQSTQTSTPLAVKIVITLLLVIIVLLLVFIVRQPDWTERLLDRWPLARSTHDNSTESSDTPVAIIVDGQTGLQAVDTGIQQQPPVPAFAPPSLDLDYRYWNHSCVLFSSLSDACPLPPIDVDSVHISQDKRTQNTSVTHLKSWFLHQPPSVVYNFFILTDDVKGQRNYFSSIISAWPLDRSLHRYTIIFLDILSLPQQYRTTLEHFKKCATARVYLPLLLPSDVTAITYLDVDSLLLNDPRLLWAHFALQTPTQWISFAWETDHNEDERNWYKKQEKHYNFDPNRFPWVKPWGINSGVMLLNLTKLRSFTYPLARALANGTIVIDQLDYLQTMYHVFDKHHATFYLGDQDWYNAFIAELQHTQPMSPIFSPLPMYLNWRSMSAVTIPTFTTPNQPLTILHGNDRHFTEKDAFSQAYYQAYFNFFGWPTKR